MIRLVTLNLWQEQGPHVERLQLVERRLRELAPDLVCLQEVRQVPGKIPNQAETLARGLGLHFTYETAQPWGGGDEGLAILSRFPIASRELEVLPTIENRSRRICLGAEVDAPEGRTWVFTTHLEFRLDDGALREREVLAVERFVRAHKSKTASLLTGDFNAGPDADEIRFLRGLTSLEGRRVYYQDAFALCNPGVDGHTWSSENPYTRLLDWIEPDRRLDYIFVTHLTSRGAGRIHSCRIILKEPDERGVFCSDHFGLVAEVQVAETPKD
jgi:endonuclease/exonuclease/phosphatase family metal-dependent hydrolase